MEDGRQGRSEAQGLSGVIETCSGAPCRGEQFFTELTKIHTSLQSVGPHAKIKPLDFNRL